MNEWEWHGLEDKTPLNSVEISGVAVQRGSRVRLRPRKGGDVLDIALAGKFATSNPSSRITKAICISR